MATTFLTRTPGSAGNRQTWTISAWIKRGVMGTYQNIVCSRSDANNALHLAFDDEDRLFYQHYLGGSVLGELKTNRKFRDPSAWYNVVITFDSTNGTAGDRQKMFINGVEETVFDTDTNISQNQTSDWNDISNPMYIGQGGNSNNYWTGSMSYVAFIDGTAEAPTIFGETDATTGEWKIKTAISPSSAWGTNGFLLLKDGAVITDSSTNSNNFTVGAGTLTKTEDCPDNVFSTLSPLHHDHANANSNFSNGNTLVLPQANANYNYAVGTLGMPKGNGKFYFEAKYLQYDDVEAAVGIVDMDRHSELFYENRPVVTASNTTAIGRVILNADGHSIIAGTANSSYGFGSWANNDIICMACDMENGAFYFRKNGGSWANSGNPESGSTKTGAIDISSTTPWTSSVYWGVWVGDAASGGYDKFAMNFGNGYFQTTAVSSAGTNASGNGIFEYDVPAGYTALSTKGLNL